MTTTDKPEKRFLPRVVVEFTTLSGMIAGIYLKDLEIRPSFGMPEEYLSLEEALYREKLARAEAYQWCSYLLGVEKQAAEIMAEKAAQERAEAEK